MIMPNHQRDKVIKHVPFCSCGAKGLYYSKYDSYACIQGDIWLEPAEKISDVMYFQPRPEKPSEGIL